MTIESKWATIKTDDVMNDQDNKNTLISQGSRLQQLSGKKKSNLAVAMFAILFFHAAVLGALLIQGCKQEPPQPETTATNEVALPTNSSASTVGEAGLQFHDDYPGAVVQQATNATLPVADTSRAVAALPPETNAVIPGVQGLPGAQTPTSTQQPGIVQGALTQATPAASEMKDHTVKSGENYTKIARAYPGVTVTDLLNANPGVDPRYLQVGQVVKIPPASASKTAATVTTATPAANTQNKPAPGSEYKDTDGQTVYLVAPGDSLTRISKKFGVKIADLKSENRLASDRINVGQKLRIPSKSPATPAPATPSGTTTGTGALAPLPSATDSGSGTTQSTGRTTITPLGN